jgi:DNA-binding CsgD family transcriptional regulator
MHMTLVEKIRRLTLAGKSQKQIVRLTRTSRGTVYRCQAKLGLNLPRHGRRSPPLPEAQEAEVLALLKSGRGTSWIGRYLGIGEHRARLVAKKFNFRRKLGDVGYRYRVSAAKREKIVEEILGRRNFCRTLAHKHKVSDKFVRKLAHELLGVSAFRSGYAEPLLSNYPQKHHDRKAIAT